MPPPRVLNRLLLAAAGLLVPAVLSVSPATAPVAHAADCPDIEVVFARGTTEAAGVGAVGQAFIDALRGMTGGRSMGVYAVNYPASWDFLAAADGANDASAHIQWMIANCPATRLVLGGYSQGAAIIDVIAAVPFPAVGFNAPLPPHTPNHVAALAVFGNPTAKAGLPLTISPVWGSRSIDLCAVGDPVCSNGDTFAAHRGYATSGQAVQAAGFVAGLL